MPHKSSKNPLVMYSVNPQGVSFENQESGEKIILFLRAHFITLLPAILQIIIIFILPEENGSRSGRNGIGGNISISTSLVRPL